MFVAILVTVGAVLGSVYLHLLVLTVLRRILLRVRSPKGHIISVMVLGAIVGHLLEIGLFAAGLFLLKELYLHDQPEFFRASHFDAFYYSAAAYTSLGDPPLPVLQLRLLIMTEALTGLILITWTASFLFLVMQREWGKNAGRE